MSGRRGAPVLTGASVLALVLAGALAVGCGRGSGGSPTGPSGTTLTGVWSGSIQDPQAGAGRLNLVLDQRPVSASQSLVTGTWTVTFPAGSRNNSGTVSGIVSGSDVTMELNPAMRPACPPGPFPLAAFADGYSLAMPFSATRLTGTSRFYTCQDVLAGLVDLGR